MFREVVWASWDALRRSWNTHTHMEALAMSRAARGSHAPTLEALGRLLVGRRHYLACFGTPWHANGNPWDAIENRWTIPEGPATPSESLPLRRLGAPERSRKPLVRPLSSLYGKTCVSNTSWPVTDNGREALRRTRVNHKTRAEIQWENKYGPALGDTSFRLRV